MFGVLEETKNSQNPALMNEVVLAYIGDCVYELYVRNMAIASGIAKVNELHKFSSSFVKASCQSAALKRLESLLTDEELAVVKRAKNKRVHSKPKNADLFEYKEATAFEALIGYLYILGDLERMESLINMALGLDNRKEQL